MPTVEVPLTKITMEEALPQISVVGRRGLPLEVEWEWAWAWEEVEWAWAWAEEWAEEWAWAWAWEAAEWAWVQEWASAERRGQPSLTFKTMQDLRTKTSTANLEAVPTFPECNKSMGQMFTIKETSLTKVIIKEAMAQILAGRRDQTSLNCPKWKR